MVLWPLLLLLLMLMLMSSPLMLLLLLPRSLPLLLLLLLPLLPLVLSLLLIPLPVLSVGLSMVLQASGAISVRQKPSSKPRTRLDIFESLQCAGLGALRQQVTDGLSLPLTASHHLHLTI